ncbi:MAG: DUF2271 domain-containing protein [Spirochaetaceae bacterium]|nr:DUF2271 domain-containing protein [Spirochaetaceae bacterium]
MKRVMLFCMVLCAAGLAGAAAQSRSAEISFAYTRQNGSGSNQFAVWIEDAAGRYVKTLYATRFTASGGWQRRPLSVPLWVQKAGVKDLSGSDIDALTGSTPAAGSLKYRWDGTDAKGKAVPAGEYRVYLEATLRGENRVLYSAVIRLGAEAGEAAVTSEYFGAETAERGMVSGVKVRTGN